MKTSVQEHLMEQALALAERGRQGVSPNPMVGALVVREGKILGEGWHARYGDIHAEEAALEDCRHRGESPQGADLYVSLEPCSFQGEGKHNGPCTEKILEAGITRVFVASEDPHPKVQGRGIRFLLERGISVLSGILAEKEERLNEIYRRIQEEKRPFVELKAALTADGFLAAQDGSSRWVSCDASRKKVMEMRSECDAILVGRGTLFADSPSLTVRDEAGIPVGGKQPVRVILSGSGKLPEGWPGPGGQVLVYENEAVRRGNPDFSSPPGVERIPIPADERGLPLGVVLEDLQNRGLRRLLVEGGGEVYRSFLKGGCWDRLTLFQAPDLLGRGIPFCGDLGIQSMDKKIILAHRLREFSGRDLMIQGYRSLYAPQEDRCSRD